MTADEVRAAAAQLHTLHARFAPCFGYRQAQQNALIYLTGLLLAEGRKSVEPIALRFGDGKVHPLQQFLTESPWNSCDVQRELQLAFAETIVPSTSQWQLGTVGVLDESSDPKKGKASVGVARQWCGRLGKKENCQVGVFLVGVTPAGTALLDHQLYLPEEWILDGTRRQQTRIPRSVTFRTKPQIGLDLHKRLGMAGHVRLDWLVFDELYGRNEEFLAELGRRRQRYVGEVPVNTTVWTEDPATQVPPAGGRGRRPTRPRRDSVRSVAEVAAALPESAWTVLCLREGAGEPVTFLWTRVRVWAMRDSAGGPPVWLLVRKSLGAGAEVKYYVSNAGVEESLETLALVSGCRMRVEEYFEDAKGYLGMADNEGRSWTTWHHHMSLVAVAHLLVTGTRMRLKKKRRA